MKYLKKLRYSKVYIALQNNYFLIGTGIVLALLTYHDFLYLTLFLPYLVYLYKRLKIGLFGLFFVLVIYFGHFLILEYRPIYAHDFVSGQVISINKKEKYNQIILKTKECKVMVYDKDFTMINVGDVICVSGEIVNIDGTRVWNGFDYKSYLKHNKIGYVLSSKNITKIEHRFHINILKEKVFSYFEQQYDKDSLIFLKALVLGDDDGFSDDLVESLKVNGTFHLFAISGSHINLFILIISNFLDKLRFKENRKYTIIFIFLGLYLIITSFSASILRASLSFCLIYINKKLKLELSTIDCASIIFIFLLLINPYYIYNLGFSLSFIVSIMILLVSDLLPKKEIMQSLFISAIAMVISFPLTVNINYEVNLLSPISNVIYIFLVEGVILPISLLVVVLPILSIFYKYMVSSFSYLSILFSKYFVIKISFPKMESIDIIIYYLLIWLFLKFIGDKKIRRIIIISFVLFLGIFSNKIIFSKNEIYFLDLYYGESSVIVNRGKVIVIDTGDGTNEVLTNFLKSKGIKRIDYLILTHNHDDHNGEVDALIKNFYINKILISEYDNSVIGKNVVRIKDDIRLKVLTLNLIIYPPSQNYPNVNDNSLIVLLEMGNKRILFTGDVTSSVECNYPIEKVDVLKVSHHGSSTSTTPSFLKKVHPEYAVIMTGRVKQFGFPHSQTISNLEDMGVKVYRTDLHYSIKLKIRNGNCIFSYLNEII